MSPPTHSTIEFIFLQLLRYVPYKVRKLFIILALFIIISPLSIFIFCACVCHTYMIHAWRSEDTFWHWSSSITWLPGISWLPPGWQDRQQHIYLMSHLVILQCYFLFKHIKSFSFLLGEYSQEKKNLKCLYS